MNRLLHMLWKHLPTAASVAVGILPIVILILWFDVPRKIIGNERCREKADLSRDAVNFCRKTPYTTQVQTTHFTLSF